MDHERSLAVLCVTRTLPGAVAEIGALRAALSRAPWDLILVDGTAIDPTETVAIAREARPEVPVLVVPAPLSAAVLADLVPAAEGTLTPRQREILALLARGRTSRSAARRLGISVKTVEAHRARIMDRLGIHDLAGLVRYAIRVGIVSADA